MLVKIKGRKNSINNGGKEGWKEEKKEGWWGGKKERKEEGKVRLGREKERKVEERQFLHVLKYA